MSNFKKIAEEVETLLPEDSENIIQYTTSKEGSVETLKITSPKNDESLILENYEGEDFRVTYEGSTQKMKNTIRSLKLSNSRQNLGDIVFHYFKNKLDKESKENASLHWDVYSGKEEKLVPTIKKLAWVYSGGKIREDFYSKT